MYDVSPARDHDPWQTITVATTKVKITRGKNKGKFRYVHTPVKGNVREHVDDEGNVWHTSDAAREHYAKDDLDTRIAEIGEKPVNPLPGGDEFAPAWVDYGSVRDGYTQKHEKSRYDDMSNAKASDKYLPVTEGGDGKRHPMSPDAIAARERREAQVMALPDVEEFTRERRTTSWDETYVKPYGAPTYRIVRDKKGKRHVYSQGAFRRAMRGPAGYLRYWTDPTSSEALRNVKGNRPERAVTIEMSRGLLKMWLRLHDIMAGIGRLTDNGRSKVIGELIANMGANDTVTFRMYSKKDIRWIAKKAPKSYREGDFGEFLKFLAST